MQQHTHFFVLQTFHILTNLCLTKFIHCIVLISKAKDTQITLDPVHILIINSNASYDSHLFGLLSLSRFYLLLLTYSIANN